MVKMSLVEISAPPNRPFWGGYGWIFFGPHQWGSKAFAKSFWRWSNHFGAMEASQSRKLPKLGPKIVVLQKFLHPQIDLFGAGWSNFFGPRQRGPKALRKIFGGYLTDSWALYGCWSQKSLILGQKTEISESQYGRNFCIWVSGPPQKFFLS